MRDIACDRLDELPGEVRRIHDNAVVGEKPCNIRSYRVSNGLAAREQLLIEEKQLTRLRDQVNARRRELPWVKVEKNYVFDGPNGRETLADLFAGRSQLVVRHFMFGPDGGRDVSDARSGRIIWMARCRISSITT